MQAVRRPPPGQRVLHPVDGILRQIEDREIERKQDHRMVLEPGDQILQQGGILARDADPLVDEVAQQQKEGEEPRSGLP